MMKTDAVIRSEGMRVLSERLGILEAERFISLILREPFDYTEWQRNLYDDLSVEELSTKAMQYWDATH
jgi:hypothetical protein